MSPQLPDLHINMQFDPTELPTGTHKIGRYILDRELGRGRMGKVYLAYDPFIDRMVAIKTAFTTSNCLNNIDEVQQRFFNEARAAGKLMHPNIVALHDVLLENDDCYLIMEYVDGTTLRQYCSKESKLSLEEAINIIFQCFVIFSFYTS